MLIEVNTTWTTTNNGSGTTARGTGRAFDTDTLQLVTFNVTKYLALGDPVPANVRLVAGDYLHGVCNTTTFALTQYLYSGTDSVYTNVLANSPTCGYVAPLTCNLLTASVSQATTATGVRVTVAYTGTVNGQAQYSLDGGTEQVSPVFAGVAAGAHTAQVRDDGLAGCAVSVNFTVAGAGALPPAPTGPSQGVDLVGQPLWRTLALPLYKGALVELELWAERAHGAANFAPVLTLRKRVGSDGQVSFRLDTLLWPLLSAFVPDPTLNATTRCTTNLVDYYVRLTTTPLDPALPAVHGVSDLRTALRGGLPAEWQATDYFAYRLSAAFALPPFLSWQPTGPGTLAAGEAKPVVYGQPEWLFFLCPASLQAQQLQVSRAYAMSATSTPVVDVEPLVAPVEGWAQRLLTIPLGATRPGFKFLTVQVADAAGNAVSLPAAYQFVAGSEGTRYLLFTNSLGGVDTVRCTDTARLEITLEATTEKVERPVRPGEASPAADRQVSDLTASRKLKLAIGWRTPRELDWLQELVLSREVWQPVGAQLRPLDWSKRSLTAYSDEPGLRGLLLEADYAYAPTAYAPISYA